ncbi:MAG: flagellar hook assembly protein FlgD [Proteobacteria bacterium]|nr:flagellar hook assembly protein FlgD [Pseudomonadota bacterium]
MSTVDIVSLLGSTYASTTNETTSSANTLGYEEFLDLFLVELQNQDPLEPMSNTDLSQQLCNYSMLAEQQTANEYLLSLLEAQTSSLNMEAVNLIGKNVLVEDNSVVVSDGEAGDMVFDVDQDCDSCIASIFDEDGNLIRTLATSGIEAGRNTISWDGVDENGEAVEDGVYTYTLSFSGYDSDAPQVSQYSECKIVSVTPDSEDARLFTKDGRQFLYSQVIGVSQG